MYLHPDKKKYWVHCQVYWEQEYLSICDEQYGGVKYVYLGGVPIVHH